MKKLILLFALLISSIAYSQVSMAKVLKLVEITTSTRDGLTIAANEFPVIYNSTTAQFERYNGSTWETWSVDLVEANDLSTAVTWANVPDANITESSVTQHEAALSIPASQIGFTPYSTISSTEVQAAIQEVLDESASGVNFGDINTSAKIAGIVGDEEGTGSLVFNTSPILVTPALGTPSAVVLTNATGLPVAQVTQHETALTITESQISDLTHTGADNLGVDADRGDFTVATGNATIDNGVITTSKILDGTITEADLDVANSPVDEYVLSYESVGGVLLWEDRGTSPTTIVGISGTKAEYDVSLTDDDFAYSSDLYEIRVSSGVDSDVQAALDIAGTTPVRITADIIDLDYPILMDSNQTLIFEGHTIYVKTGTFTGFPFDYWNGHAVIKNRNGAGHGDEPTGGSGGWGGTGLGGETNITVIGGTIDGTGQVTYEYNGVQLHDVTNSKIINVKFNNVMPPGRTGKPQGNVDLRTSDYIEVLNCSFTNTHKSGVFIINDDVGKITGATALGHITIKGSYFNETGDSAIIGVNSYFNEYDSNYVDRCGVDGFATAGNSNITANMRWGKFTNNTSINSPGLTNGYGLTLGHPFPYPAWNTVVSGNIFENNNTKGIFLQGNTTEGNIIANNIIRNNGVGNTEPTSGGIDSNNNLSNIFEHNTIEGNKHGINISNGTTNAIIRGNIIKDNELNGIADAGTRTVIQNNFFEGNDALLTLGGIDMNQNPTSIASGNMQLDGGAYTADINKTFAIKGDLPVDANLMEGSLLKLQSNLKSPNDAGLAGKHLGIAMYTDTRGTPYGMTLGTYIDTDRSDFALIGKAHQNNETGTEIFRFDNTGNLTLANNATADLYILDDPSVTNRNWATSVNFTNQTLDFMYEDSPGAGTYGTKYTLSEDGVPTSATDLVDKAYADALGDVTKVGTPIDNQVAVWTGNGTAEGTSSLTYNGSTLGLTGDLLLNGGGGQLQLQGATSGQANIVAPAVAGTPTITMPTTDLNLADVLLSDVTGEPTGSDRIDNIVSLTQSEYDAGTPVAGTTYIITDGKETFRETIPITAEGADIAVADGVTSWFTPVAVTLLNVYAGLKTAPTGTGATFDIEEDDGTPATILSTLLTIDVGERSSNDAAIPAVISDPAIAADSFLEFNIDVIGSTIAGATGFIVIEYTID